MTDRLVGNKDQEGKIILVSSAVIGMCPENIMNNSRCYNSINQDHLVSCGRSIDVLFKFHSKLCVFKDRHELDKLHEIKPTSFHQLRSKQVGI